MGKNQYTIDEISPEPSNLKVCKREKEILAIPKSNQVSGVSGKSENVLYWKEILSFRHSSSWLASLQINTVLTQRSPQQTEESIQLTPLLPQPNQLFTNLRFPPFQCKFPQLFPSSSKSLSFPLPSPGEISLPLRHAVPVNGHSITLSLYSSMNFHYSPNIYSPLFSTGSSIGKKLAHSFPGLKKEIVKSTPFQILYNNSFFPLVPTCLNK